MSKSERTISMTIGLAVVCAGLLSSACGGVDREPPAKPDPGTPGIVDLSVADDTMKQDKVAPRDDGVVPDGTPDGIFRAHVVGPILNMSLVTTKDDGTSEYGQVYDTLTGKTAVPPEISTYFQTGSETWVLGIFEDDALVNHEDGSLGSLPAGEHELELYGNSVGLFGAGLEWRLSIELEDHTWVDSELVKY